MSRREIPAEKCIIPRNRYCRAGKKPCFASRPQMLLCSFGIQMASPNMKNVDESGSGKQVHGGISFFKSAVKRFGFGHNAFLINTMTEENRTACLREPALLISKLNCQFVGLSSQTGTYG
ncbi:hypothetical protein [Desulfonatronum parangueonense]